MLSNSYDVTMSEFHNGEGLQWVDQPMPSDILFGRGDRANKHMGNNLFRDAIKKRKTEYILAGKDRLRKAKIAEEIVASLRAEQHELQPRFLRKATVQEAAHFGIPQGSWCTVNEESVLEKTKQALRQKASRWMESAQTNKTPFDDQRLSDRHDSVSLSILLGEQEEPEAFERAFLDKQIHLQEEQFPFKGQDHLSESPSPPASTHAPDENLDAIQNREGLHNREASPQAKQDYLQTETSLFNKKYHLPDNHSITSTTQSVHQGSMASVGEASAESDFFGAILFDDTVETEKVEYTTNGPITSNGYTWVGVEGEGVAEKTKQGFGHEASEWKTQDAPPCDDAKRSLPNTSTSRLYEQQAMAPTDEGHDEDQALMDDTDIELTASSVDKVVFPHRESSTNSPENHHFFRHELVKSCKTECNAIKHHRAKFKIAQDERTTSTRPNDKKSPMFLQKATVSDALRLGIPNGTWFETRMNKIMSQGLHHETYGESSHNDSSNTLCRRRQEMTSPDHTMMVQEDVSNKAHCLEDLQIEFPQMPAKISFDFQDYPSVEPEAKPSPEEEHDLPMEPSRLQDSCNLPTTSRPRVDLQSGEVSHDDCNLLSSHIHASTSQPEQQQMLVSPSESQEDLLISQLRDLRDAYLASASTRPSDDDSSYREYEGVNDGHSSIWQKAEYKNTVTRAEEGLLTHLHSLQNSHFAVSITNHPDVQVDEASIGENQDLASSVQQVNVKGSPESMCYTMTLEDNPTQLSGQHGVDEASLYNQELLATFLEYLPTFTDVCNTSHALQEND